MTSVKRASSHRFCLVMGSHRLGITMLPTSGNGTSSSPSHTLKVLNPNSSVYAWLFFKSFPPDTEHFPFSSIFFLVISTWAQFFWGNTRHSFCTAGRDDHSVVPLGLSAPKAPIHVHALKALMVEIKLSILGWYHRRLEPGCSYR